MRLRVGDVRQVVAARLSDTHAAAIITAACATLFAVVFGYLGVRHYNNFGSWSFDMGIYDQGYWLVSRGKSFVTVRGLDFWGHHFNPIALVYSPFYWLGAGPRFLYVTQAIALAAGAIPTYLIARDRFDRPWMGLVYAVSYLMYAPVQWISWANYHPEALVITPLLFAWWFMMQRRWTAFFVSIVIALCTKEDVALAVIMLGVLLAVRGFNLGGLRQPRSLLRIGLATSALGVIWYGLATKLVIPAFNDWQQPFYIQYFYGNYGGSATEIGWNVVRHPDRVISDATQPDRLRFYRDLALPLGGLSIVALGPLMILAPQMLASVIGTTPYARQIRWQYTAVMIAPLIISSIEGGWLLWRFRVVRRFLPAYLLLSAYVTNVAWSPSPLSRNDVVWAGANGGNRREVALRAAVDLVPDDASVTATFTLLPHLAHRDEVYDWPNPFRPAYWGNDSCDRLPDPTAIDYIVIDRFAVGEVDQPMFQAMIAPDGPFEVLLDADNVLVGRRIGATDAVDVGPQRAGCSALDPGAR